MIIELIEIERKMDMINAKYGNEGTLCQFCLAQYYNGEEGVMHNKYCPILRLRDMIWELNDD